MLNSNNNIIFFVVFEEEKNAISKFLPNDINATFHQNTIQETCKFKDIKLEKNTIISIRTQSIIPEKWSSKISAILTRSTGYDHLNSFKNNHKKILYGYLPNYCARSVAEHAFLMCLALMRRLPEQINKFDTFERDGLTGFEISGKNLLLVGIGNIGIEIYKISKSMGFNVDGIDLVENFEDVNYIKKDNDIKKYDVIICAMDLNESNYSYFNDNFFKRVKKGSLFINISRGEIAPVSILNKYLNNETLSGVALDVFDTESSLAVSLRNREEDEDTKLIMEIKKHPNVILTPHNAFNTHETVLRKAKNTIEQIQSLIKKGKFIWEVP